CSRTITEQQIITIEPAPIAAWVNAPADITLTCDQATTFAASDLDYTNNGLGGCLIEGTETGVISGTFDECGGTLTQDWSFTDDCSRTITEQQIITIEPAPIAAWVNA